MLKQAPIELIRDGYTQTYNAMYLFVCNIKELLYSKTLLFSCLSFIQQFHSPKDRNTKKILMYSNKAQCMNNFSYSTTASEI